MEADWAAARAQLVGLGAPREADFAAVMEDSTLVAASNVSSVSAAPIVRPTGRELALQEAVAAW
jgi:hypothetical protein